MNIAIWMPILLMYKHVFMIKFIAKMAIEDLIAMKQSARTLYTFTIELKTIKYYFNARITENVHNQDACATNIGQVRIVVSTEEKNAKVSYYLIGQS